MQSNIINNARAVRRYKTSRQQVQRWRKNTMELYNLWQINSGVCINILSNIQKKKLIHNKYQGKVSYGVLDNGKCAICQRSFGHLTHFHIE